MRDNKLQAGPSAFGGESSPTPLEGGEKYLVFRVADFTIALEIGALKKVHDAGALPPRTPGSRVVDLHHITGADKGRSPGYWIEMEGEAGRYLIPVEEVEGIRELSLAVPIPYPRVLARPETIYIRRLLFDGLRMITLLAVNGLAELASGRLPAAGRPESKDGEPTGARFSGPGKLVAFEIGPLRGWLPLERVVQIISRDDLFPVPSATSGVMGVAYYSDHAVPVLKPSWLGGLLGKPIQPPEPEFNMIVLAESSQGMIGFPGERVLKVMDRTATENGAEDRPESSSDHRAGQEIAPDQVAKKLIEA